MIDVWTKQAPDGTTITFKKEGTKEVGYIYSAEGRTVKETSSMRDELTRLEVETLFADYVKGTK
ncbi:MAG: hypothetical protein DMG39_06990 [Acidobacteria bacterium]|nr:MAG: hypothetical protein DMG39_06990 [Acidobacteriota bacterium]